MAEVYVGYVDVDIDLEDFDSDELKEELERRGVGFVDNIYVKELLRIIYEKRRNGQDYKYELDTILYETIGRVS